MPEKSNKRLLWVDQIKGLAILTVVLFHFLQNYPDHSSLVTILARNATKFGFEAVEIFFVLAGFNISYSWQSKSEFSWSKWLKKRILRLYPSYWLAIVLICFLYFLSGKIKLESWQNLLLIILGLPNYYLLKQINPGFWFFSVILQAYLITPLLFYNYQKNPIHFLRIAIFLGLLYKLLCGYLLFTGKNSIFYYLLSENLILSYIFSYSLGLYWGFIYKDNRNFRSQDWLYSIISFIVALIPYVILSQQPHTFYKLGFDIFFTPLCFLLCYWICKKALNKKSKFNYLLARIGFFSYHIYLIHQPILFLTLPILMKNLVFSPLSNLAISLIIVIFLISAYTMVFIKLDDLIKNKISIILK